MAQAKDNAFILVRILGLFFIVLGVTSGAYTIVALVLEIVVSAPLPEGWQAISYYGVTGVVSCPAYVLSGVFLFRFSARIAKSIAPKDPD